MRYKHASKIKKPFPYVHSSKTDIRKTFSRLRAADRERAEAEAEARVKVAVIRKRGVGK